MKFMCKGRNQELIDGCSNLVKKETIMGRPLYETLTKDVNYYTYLKDLSPY